MKHVEEKMTESQGMGGAPNIDASLTRVVNLIDGERSAICDYAVALVNDVREQMAKRRAVLPYSERGQLNVRALVTKDVSVSIHWYRVRSYSGNARSKGEFSDPVTRGSRRSAVTTPPRPPANRSAFRAASEPAAVPRSCCGRAP